MSLFGLGIGLASSIYNGISAGKRRNEARDLQNRLENKARRFRAKADNL